MFLRLGMVLSLGFALLFGESFLLADKIIVKKSARMLYLSSGGEIFKKYHVSLGRVPVGDKEIEGDMKTPEGVYALDYRQLSDNYYKSLHISYPNAEDKAHAKSLGQSAGGIRLTLKKLQSGFIGESGPRKPQASTGLVCSDTE